MRLRLQLTILAAIACAVFGGWWWLAVGSDLLLADGGSALDAGNGGKAGSGGNSGKADKGVPVLIEPVSKTEDRVTVRAVGTGKALRSVDLYPSVTGEVVEVAFTAGQQVKEGDPLLRLDAEEQRIAVRLAEVTAREASRQVKRFDKLAPTGAVALARLQAAEAELESARLRLAQAREALADRTVFAPFDGVMGLTDIDRGDRVSPDTFIASIDDRSSLLIEFTVPENVAARVAPGDSIALSAWTLPGEQLRATVSATGSQIDPVTRALRVRASLPNAGGRIRPGTSFEVRIEIAGDSYPAVREVAVLWSRDGAYVWRVGDKDRAEKVFGKVVRRDRGRVLLDGPLAVGDRIVIEGVQGLREGTRVAPKPFEATPTGAGAKG